ncbi:MAG TPA: 16S rRNA (uracil(1498)-N(3))-methyltransferase [Anaeromyxobacteraceae bacterium]|nr:16S rRNA (uracil(1498)-N(3))-methyltransferase [Anaeromyxobacteraceae bacterium]
MNLVLLEEGDLQPDGTARLSGRRARHALEVLRVAPGDRIAVGLLGGSLGEGEVLSTSPAELCIRPSLTRAPPDPSPVSLLLALPRPKILRKVLAAVASMGVKDVVLLGTYRVEKSYFGSPSLRAESMAEALKLGLEQGRDTRLPRVSVRRFFKPFVEDELDSAFPSAARRLLAHPAAPGPLEGLPAPRGRAVLAIGPEGGFTSYEARELEWRGFAPFSLGPRPLRVDAAVGYAVGQVELWLRWGARPPPPER